MLFTVVAIACTTGGLWLASTLLEPTPAGPPEAPHPADHPGAVVRVYGANVWGMRGRFAIHTWVATKLENDASYTLYQVIGWRLRRTGSVVSIHRDRPDKPWFGSPAILLHEVSGEGAQQLVREIHDAALRYPYPGEYTMWPGPNSNSFTQWIALEVPELGLELPFKALGKNWMDDNHAEALVVAERRETRSTQPGD